MPETIGLDIGSHSIKLVGIKTTSKGPFLNHLEIRQIPYGKNDVKEISEILIEMVRKAGLRTKRVRVSVSGTGTIIRQIIIPSMPKAEINKAVRWEMKAHLPFPIDTAHIDFNILEEFVEDGVKKLDLIVVACPENLIKRSISIVEGAGLQITHLDVAPFALWNVLIFSNLLKKGETIALLDLGGEKTGIHIFKDKILQFSREITPAGSDFTQAVMEEIISEGGSQGLYEEAERIKKEIGIPSEDQLKGKLQEKINLSKISFLLRPLLERMVGEIGRSMDYFRSQFNVERIDRVLLTGGGAGLKNLISYLSRELDCPVQYLNPLKEILFDSKKINPEIIEERGSTFAIAFGMALLKPKRIELLPAKKPFFSRIQSGKLIPIIASFITIFILLCIIWVMNGKLATAQKELDLKREKVAVLSDLRSKLRVLKEKEEKVKKELSLYPSSISRPVPYRALLREIHQILPENMTLTYLEIHKKGSPLKKELKGSTAQTQDSQIEEKEIYFSGLVFGTDFNCLNSLAKFIERLENSPFFKNVKLISAEENKSYNRPSSEFKILSDIILNEEKRIERPSL